MAEPLIERRALIERASSRNAVTAGTSLDCSPAHGKKCALIKHRTLLSPVTGLHWISSTRS
jgi:hypothetical protein